MDSIFKISKSVVRLSVIPIMIIGFPFVVFTELIISDDKEEFKYNLREFYSDIFKI